MSKNKNTIKDKFKPLKDGEENRFKSNIPPQKSGLGNKIFLFVAIAIVALLLLTKIFSPESQLKEVSYTTYRELLNDSLIASCEILKDAGITVIYGKLRKRTTLADIKSNTITIEKFQVKSISFDKAMMDELLRKNVSVKIDTQSNSIVDWLIILAPWLILGFIYFMFMQRSSSQNAGITRTMMGFGKSRAKMISEFDIKVKFSDVAGCREAKQDLEEMVEFLKEPKKFTQIGAKIPKGALLLGPPGTGKTMLAKAVSGEAKVPFFSLSGSDFVEMFVGVGASRVRDLFDQAKQNSPCIVFIDEIDAVGRQRGAGFGGGHDEREQTLNQLLVEMDGFTTNSSVIVLAATNRPDVLDKALLRPGRFDRQVIIDMPNVKDRLEILKIHAAKIQIEKHVDFEKIAKATPGFSGANLANLINEATILAARNNRKKVTWADFENAKDKILMGPERQNDTLTSKQKELTAYHESGHVLVAKFTDETDPIHKVTIIPRGQALGVTSYLPDGDEKMYTRKYIVSMITYILGGRAAEEVIYNEITTGASNDIERATSLARKMVCEWGMNEKIGPVNYSNNSEEVFLGRDYGRVKEHSEEISKFIDTEVSAIIDSCMRAARRILKDNIELLHKLTKSLIEKETLTGEEIDNIIAGKFS